MQTEAMGREKTFNIRFSDEEWARLERVSKHYGLTAAGVIRMTLKEKDGEIAALGAEPLDERDLYAEACRKLTQRGRREGVSYNYPSQSSSGLETRGSKTQFVLRNSTTEIARFNVTPSGDLRMIKD